MMEPTCRRHSKPLWKSAMRKPSNARWTMPSQEAGFTYDVQAGRFEVKLQQHGLLRPLSAAELSDGTLRFLLWTAALLTPPPPRLIVLHGPETSITPDL